MKRSHITCSCFVAVNYDYRSFSTDVVLHPGDTEYCVLVPDVVIDDDLLEETERFNVGANVTHPATRFLEVDSQRDTATIWLVDNESRFICYDVDCRL